MSNFPLPAERREMHLEQEVIGQGIPPRDRRLLHALACGHPWASSWQSSLSFAKISEWFSQEQVYQRCLKNATDLTHFLSADQAATESGDV